MDTQIPEIDVSPADIVVLHEDLIYRGPDSSSLLERAIRLSTEANVIPIRGNHEDKQLHSLEHGPPRTMWISAGATATLNSYGGAVKMIPQTPHGVRDVDVSPTTKRPLTFVHANVDPDHALEGQSDVWLRWQALTG